MYPTKTEALVGLISFCPANKLHDTCHKQNNRMHFRKMDNSLLSEKSTETQHEEIIYVQQTPLKT